MAKDIFISHASKDKPIVSAFIDEILVGALAVKLVNIFCTTIDGTKIESGEDWRNSIKNYLELSKITFLFITPNYKESEVCLNEMGAAWVCSGKVIPLIVDPIDYMSVGIIQQPKQIERLVDESSLDRIRDVIQKELNIPIAHIKSDRWTLKKNEFIEKVSRHLAKTPFSPSLSHDEYDSKTSQSKGWTKEELKLSKEKLNTFARDKHDLSLVNYFIKKGLKYFLQKSLPLDNFDKKEVVIVCSSLYAPHNDKSKKYYSLVKPMKDTNGEWKDVPVGSGFNVTGIRDVFGLTKLSIALIQRSSFISIVSDPVDEKLKKENLCLLGGKSSNLVARELYYDYLPLKYQFHGEKGGLNIHGNNFKGGGYGYILSMKNPWNKNKRVIWLAGLGPLGTGATVDFIINSFQDKAPSELLNRNEWILFVRGIAKKGSIAEVHQIGHYIIS